MVKRRKLPLLLHPDQIIAKKPLSEPYLNVAEDSNCLDQRRNNRARTPHKSDISQIDQKTNVWSLRVPQNCSTLYFRTLRRTDTPPPPLLFPLLCKLVWFGLVWFGFSFFFLKHTQHTQHMCVLVTVNGAPKNIKNTHFCSFWFALFAFLPPMVNWARGTTFGGAAFGGGGGGL
jgi:hypothetical protein